MMLISASLYPDFSGITTLEELSITLARSVLSIQSDVNKNPQKLDYVDITQNEDEKTIDITWKDIPCNIINGNIDILNLFDDNFTPGTGSYPFNQTSLLGAAIHVFMFQSVNELNTNNNNLDESYLSFSIESIDEFDLQYKCIFSGSASGLPLVYENVGGKQVSFGQTYLL